MFLNEAKEFKAFSMGVVESENGFASILSEAILTEEEAVKSGDDAKKEANVKSFFTKVKDWLKEQLTKLKNLAGRVLRSIRENFGALKHRVTSGEWLKGSHARHKVAYLEGIVTAAARTVDEVRAEVEEAKKVLDVHIEQNYTKEEIEKAQATYDAKVEASKKAMEKFREADARADEVYSKIINKRMDKAQKQAEKAGGVKAGGAGSKLLSAGEGIWKSVSGLVSKCISSITGIFSKSKSTGNVETDKENRNLVLRAKSGIMSALSSIGRGIGAIFRLILKPIKFLVGKFKKGEEKEQAGPSVPAVAK